MPETVPTNQTETAPTLRIAAWRWALLQTRRDLRSGSMRFLLVAVVLAVAALTAVAFFADRIERGLSRDAAQLMGADAVVVGDQPLPAEFEARAVQLGLRVARTSVMASMARAPDDKGGEARLAAVKAVSAGHPLRGRLTLGALQPDGQVQPTGPAPAGGPEAGHAWVDAGILLALNLQVGDSLWLGERSFIISAVIQSEPDRGAGFINFSPRVLIRESDLASTELVQPASRVTHRLLVAGPARAGDSQAPVGSEEPEAAKGPKAALTSAVDAEHASGPDNGRAAQAVQRFVSDSRERIEALRGLKVETLDQGRPEMRATLDRAGLFLRLVALLAALLSAVAVALVSRDFAQRRLDDCALLRVMGVPQRTMAWIYGLQFLFVGLLASALGLMLGWAFHLVFVELLANLVIVSLPQAGWQPWGLGVGVGVLLTLGFGLPPVLQLASVPPLRVLRRDLGGLRPWSAAMGLFGAVALFGLLLAVARDLRMGAIALGGFVAAMALFALLGGLAIVLLRRAVERHGERLPNWLSLATRQVTAQPGHSIVQVCALGIGLLALMLLVLIRTDLITSWKAASPPDAPNRFVINIQPDQVEAFQQALRKGGVGQYDWFPMARGRLVAINGKPVRPQDFVDDRAHRLVDREFNLSHAVEPPRRNDLVGGRFLPEEPNAFSVEEGIAQTLGLKLGDTLRFDLAGQFDERRITSLRRVDWSSMRVNFFVMTPRAAEANWPATWITAFRMPAGSVLDRNLVQDFPNVTVVDVTATLAQVQSVLDQVITAVEFLFAFTLAAGLIVLMAGLMTSRERRAREWAVLRSLGATQGLLARVQRFELIGLGALAGALAASASLAIGWALSSRVFEFPWTAPWWWPLVGAFVGALLAWGAGWWSLRGVLARPVAMTLRRAD
ncbi:ABC transporter permease [Aquabacterium parvum]|uniref:ABC transporter permease n=1 Tax=Aquabacterium parvum TaxID=70584 RepID=UPI000718D6CA|nr:FtsX-like permease family protein [Aquabacterium parvum]MBU0917749.1 FtsX-like permease family protein [Gammaproteobacteria bacterium]